MKICRQPKLTPSGHSIEYLETLSERRLSIETGIDRHTLRYRLNTMGLSVEEAVTHKKNKWVRRKSQYKSNIPT